MKSRQIRSILVVLCLLATVVAGSIGSIGVSTGSNAISGKAGRLLKVKARSQTIGVTSLNLLETTDFDFNDANVYVLSNETDGESQPSMVTYINNVLVAYEFEDENGTHVFLKKSNDHGQSWSDSVDLGVIAKSDYDIFSPCLTTKPGTNDGYGAIISEENDSAVLCGIEFDNIGNLNSISISSVDWSNLTNTDEKFWGFKDATIVYNDSNYLDKYIVTVIGSTDLEDSESGEGPCVDAPMFFYRDAYGSKDFWISWDPTFEHCSNLSTVMDHSSNVMYGVCEIENGSKNDILFFNDNPTLWDSDSVLSNHTITYSQSLLHPTILVKDDNVYVVAETESQGLIVFVSSKNDCENWNIYTVVSKSGAASPMLYTSEADIACYFAESGNLSMVTSDDSGQNWSDPVKINNQNGTVDSGYRNFDVTDLGRVVWTDNRQGNNDLYYLLGHIPTADLEITDFTLEKDILLPTHNWISINITNMGESPLSNIPVNITYTCDDGNATSTDYPGYIKDIGAGEKINLKQPLFNFGVPEYFQSLIRFAGIENITVHADSADDIDASNNVLQKQVSYDEIFIKLAALEDIFKILKPLIS